MQHLNKSLLLRSESSVLPHAESCVHKENGSAVRTLRDYRISHFLSLEINGFYLDWKKVETYRTIGSLIYFLSLSFLTKLIPFSNLECLLHIFRWYVKAAVPLSSCLDGAGWKFRFVHYQNGYRLQKSLTFSCFFVGIQKHCLRKNEGTTLSVPLTGKFHCSHHQRRWAHLSQIWRSK